MHVDEASSQQGSNLDRDIKRAELLKLQAELRSLNASHFSKPANWIPLLIAVAAILTALFQFQSSNFQLKEASLEYERKSFEADQATAKLQQSLKERDAELVEKKQELEDANEELRLAIEDEIKIRSRTEKFAAEVTESLEIATAKTEAKVKLWEQLISERKQLVESDANSEEVDKFDQKISELLSEQKDIEAAKSDFLKGLAGASIVGLATYFLSDLIQSKTPQ